MDSLLEKGLKQIEERKYFEKYLDCKKKILLLSAGFVGKEIGCRMMVLEI